MKRSISNAAVGSGLLLIAAAAWLIAAQQSMPDIVLSNGKVITVDERFSIAQAIAIKGDRILAVGPNSEIVPLTGSNTRRIDLRGRAVIPGLIDNHMHLLRAGATWKWEMRWDGAASPKAARESLRAQVKKRNPRARVRDAGRWTV